MYRDPADTSPEQHIHDFVKVFLPFLGYRIVHSKLNIAVTVKTGLNEVILSDVDITTALNKTTALERTKALIPIDAEEVKIEYSNMDLDLDFVDTAKWENLKNLIISATTGKLNIPTGSQFEGSRFPKLEEITFPVCLDTIGSQWFGELSGNTPIGNTKIQYVTANGATLIDEQAFCGCTGLIELNAPKTAIVQKQALRRCEKLKYLPGSEIEEMHYYAAYDAKIMGARSPLTKLRYIGQYAFYCSYQDPGLSDSPIEICTDQDIRMEDQPFGFAWQVIRFEAGRALNTEGIPKLGQFYISPNTKDIMLNITESNQQPTNFWGSDTGIGIRTWYTNQQAKENGHNVLSLPLVTSTSSFLPKMSSQYEIPTVSIHMPVYTGGGAGTCLDNAKIKILWWPSASKPNATTRTPPAVVNTMALGAVDASMVTWITNMWVNTTDTNLILPNGTTNGSPNTSAKIWCGKEWKSVTMDWTQQKLIEAPWEKIEQLHAFLQGVAGATKPTL